MSVLKKRVQHGGDGVPTASPAILFPKSLQSLKEHMTTCVYPGTNTPRETTTVTMFYDQGQIKVFLNDRDNGVATCVSSSSWDALWIAVEAALNDPDTEWREGKKKR